jgi:hypothetical protein
MNENCRTRSVGVALAASALGVAGAFFFYYSGLFSRAYPKQQTSPVALASMPKVYQPGTLPFLLNPKVSSAVNDQRLLFSNLQTKAIWDQDDVKMVISAMDSPLDVADLFSSNPRVETEENSNVRNAAYIALTYHIERNGEFDSGAIQSQIMPLVVEWLREGHEIKSAEALVVAALMDLVEHRAVWEVYEPYLKHEDRTRRSIARVQLENRDKRRGPSKPPSLGSKP